MLLQVVNRITGQEGRYTMLDVIDAFGDYEIVVGDTSSRKGPCITILVDQTRRRGMIQNAVYRPMCEIDGKMEPHTGTILMLQGALRYVFTTYKELKHVTLNDKSSVATKDIHITAKRLLQKRKGWYQEWLGAVVDEADMPTTRLMKKLGIMKLSDQDEAKVSERNWGTTKDIEDLARRYLGNEASSIIGTAWKISRKTVSAYPVDVYVQTGGDAINTDNAAAAKHMTRLFKMWKRLSKNK